MALRELMAAVCLPHRGDPDNRHQKVEIRNHVPDDGQLLRVLLPEIGQVRPHHIQQQARPSRLLENARGDAGHN